MIANIRDKRGGGVISVGMRGRVVETPHGETAVQQEGPLGQSLGNHTDWAGRGG